MKSLKVVVKFCIFVVFIFAFNVIGQTIIPVSQNQIAMMQMENTVESSMGIQLYSYIKDFSWVVVVIIAIMMFKKEIKIIFNKIKEIFKNEEL